MGVVQTSTELIELLQLAREHGYLPRVLKPMIEALAEEEGLSRTEVYERLGQAAGIQAGTVASILSGRIATPPDIRLEGFAEVLAPVASKLRLKQVHEVSSPKSFDAVWDQLVKAIGTGIEVQTLSRGATNRLTVSGDAVQATTGRGSDTIPKADIQEAWTALQLKGILPVSDFPGRARYRSAAISTLLTLLPYVDHTLYPKTTLFLTDHTFSNDELSRYFGVGSSQGIRYSGPANSPRLVLFITSLANEAEPQQSHPYQDRWDGDVLYYTGEGLRGDQQMTRGNLALKSSVDQDFPIYGFRKADKNEYQYLGRFKVEAVTTVRHPDEQGEERETFVFQMRRIPPEQGSFRNVVVIYVGQNGLTNLEVGLRKGVWGFKKYKPRYDWIRPGDLVVFGTGYTGGSPRTTAENWQRHSLRRLVLGRVTRAMYEDDSIIWPDENRADISYPHRFGWERLTEFSDVFLAPGEHLSEDVAEALRRSAASQGDAYIVESDHSPLLLTREQEDSNGKPPTVPAPPPSRPELDAICQQFSDALRASNIEYGSRHDDLVRSFVAGLATKPFVILTGLSGSGKTQIALRFGQWLGEGRYLPVAVRPDWTSPEALLGYEDALSVPDPETGRRAWQVPEALQFMLKAAADPDHPYLLILDEMNLAHVERYFADVLSGMESGEPVLPDLEEGEDGQWRLRAEGSDRGARAGGRGTGDRGERGAGDRSDRGRDDRGEQGAADRGGRGGPGANTSKLPVPPNLFIVGTVNVDETTYMFSPKVLDRANTFEFRVETEDLPRELDRAGQKPQDLEPGDPELVRGFLEIARDPQWHLKHSPAPEEQQDYINHLRRLHRVLQHHGWEFGHRTYYEALRFAAMLLAAGQPATEERSPIEAVLDRQVMQKVLPRLHGSFRRLDPVLREIGLFCFDKNYAPPEEWDHRKITFDPEQPGEGKPWLPTSFDKIRRLLRSARVNQFASFTE